MYSSTGGDNSAAAASAALTSRDSVFSMPSDHSAAVWERQALGRDKFDRDRYTSVKRDWSAESRSSSYRSYGVLASGSLASSFNKRRAIGRNEAVENGRHRSTMGRIEPSTSLRSPTQVGKAERDVCSPGYGSSPNMERSSKSLDGHQYRDVHSSPGSIRPLSSPHIDSRLHSNHNDPDVLGAWDLERSRFSSPRCGWDPPNKGREYRERTRSKSDYKRPCPLPKLDSSKEWSQTDRELLEGRIDRYSSVCGREMGFCDVVSGNNRESVRNDWKCRERILHSGFPAYSLATNHYKRDTKVYSHVPDTGGSLSPPQHSPLQSSFSLDSDLDVGPASSKKRPRLTWGQGLAKYEKEKTGEELSAVRKSEEGSNYLGGLHSEGSVASALPELMLQTSNVVFCSEDIHQQNKELRSSDSCLDGSAHLQHFQSCSRESLAYSSAKAFDISTSTELHLNDLIIVKNIVKSSLPEAAMSEDSESQIRVLQYMQAFISRYQQELPILTKDSLTQHVERVEFEIDRLEKELAKLDNDPEVNLLCSEKNAVATANVHSHVKLVEGALVSEPPAVFSKESPSCVNFIIGPQGSPAESSCKNVLGLVDVAEHMQNPPCEAASPAQDVPQTFDQSISSGDECAIKHDGFACQLWKKKREANAAKSAEIEVKEDWRDAVASLLSSNEKIARESAFDLAHLSAPGARTELHSEGLPWSTDNSSRWKQNGKMLERKRKQLQLKIDERRIFTRFTEGVLAIRYRAKRETWKQEQIRYTSSKSPEKDKAKHDGTWELELKGCATPSRQSPLRFCPFAGPCADVNNEEAQVAKKLLVDHTFATVREYAKMPSMVIGQKDRILHRFETKNGLVVDPVAAEQERKAMNPWAPEEKRIFLEKYSLLGKNLRKIASYLEYKSVADCVQFFYQNQKTEEFEKIHRRHQLKKRREARSSALYLATATSATHSHCEANAAYVERLILDATAAAAMSVPRSGRSLAMKSGPLGSTPSRACRDSNIATQASTACTLTAKETNLKQSATKIPQGTPNKASRRPPEEVLQWKSHWSDNERELFVNAVALYGKDFDCISTYVGSKSVGQCKAYFGKARKRLGLDQLVERHREFSLSASQQEEKLVDSTELEHHSEADLECQMGDVPELQLKLEMSPVYVNSCQASEVHGQESQSMSSRKSSPADEPVCQNVGQLVIDTPVNQDAYLTCFSTNANSESPCNSVKVRTPLDAAQGGINDNQVYGVASHQIKVEPRSLKLEFMTSSSAMAVSHSISSHGTPSATPVSALIPHLGQSQQCKDKSVKTTEVKARREPTSWTQEEKEKFVDILRVHGKNWDLLCKSLPGKSLIQIKTYFQNSKAKLGLGTESASSASGRAGSLWKRKVDDSDSSNNAGPAIQTLQQKAHVLVDEGNLKLNSSVLAAAGGPGGNVLSPDALAYANIFGRKLVEDSLNAQKVFHAMGFAANASSPGILPLLSSAVFPSPSLVSTQQSYAQAASASIKIPPGAGHQQPEQSLSSMMSVELNSSAGVHQAHESQPQQQSAVTCQELPLPGVPLGCNKQPMQLDPMCLLKQAPPPSQQLQQVAEAVLQQLLPQAVHRHQQQLQLAGQQFPHQFQQVLSHHQVQPNRPAQSQVGLGVVPASIISSQQMQQQAGLMQPHLHPSHGKLHALLQQQQQQLPQLNQLQLLQLQRLQQQQHQQLLLHLQQAQALSQPHQIQNQGLLMQQKLNFSSEQQPSALFRGFPQVPNTSGEGFKQNDLDFQTLTKSQGAFGKVQQLLVSNQVNGTPSQPQAVSEAQFPSSDIKLFGQSLLSQRVSGNQNPTAANVSSCPSPAFPVPPSIIVGSRQGNTGSNTLRGCAAQGQGWQQSTMANAQSNGALKCSTSVGENQVGSVQEHLPYSVESFNADGADSSDSRAVVSAVSHMPDGDPTLSATASLDNGIIFSAPSFSCGLSSHSLNQSDNQRSKQSANLEDNITQSMRNQESGLVSGSTGGDATVSQGLPRVLDALVALAEWRLQNCGKLTDEFLSQSWEALQKNPGSLIEAGKASSSFPQLYSEGPQMLQHLRECLPLSHTSLGHSNSSDEGFGTESAGISTKGQKVPSPVPMTCINEGGLACPDERMMVGTDGSGGAIG